LSPGLTRLALASTHVDRYYVFAYFPGAWDVLMSLDPHADSMYSDSELLSNGIQRSLGFDGIDDSMLFDDTGLNLDSTPFAGGTVTTCLNPLLQTFGTGPASGLTDVGMCIVRGMTMDTLTHQVGRRRFITGKPPSGQNARGSSISTVFASLLRQVEPIPNLAAGVETYNVDQPEWATALSVARVDDLLRALRPGNLSIAPEERERVQALLTEYRDCVVARRSPVTLAASEARLSASGLVSGGLDSAFDIFASTPEMTDLRDRFRISGNSSGTVQARAAMVAQAIATQTSRVVSYQASDNLDTHFDNWLDDQFANQYVGWRALAAMVDHLASVPHPSSGLSMMEHTTILAFSDFSRTPLVNGNTGRDHWLMNNCMLLGKGIRHGIVGRSGDDGMAPVTATVDGVEEYIKPEHIHQALLHDIGMPPDTVDLRVAPYLDVLSAS